MTIEDLPSQLEIMTATLEDYPTIQNMARFYVYDMSRYCGFISKDWACPANGLYEAYDFKTYFEDPARRAYLIKVDDELAGFVLLHKTGTQAHTDWNMGEFFMLAKFQGKGIGRLVAQKTWQMHPGIWEISVIPENKPALAFWRKIITAFTNGHYTDEIKTIAYPNHQAERHILSFDSQHNA